MSKYLLLHPDDVVRVKPIDGVTIECDKFGVTKPGEGFLVDMPDPLLQCMPIRLPQIEPEHDFTLPLSYQYIGHAFPKPNPFIGVDWSSDEMDRLKSWRKPRSLKSKLRAQRRLDRSSRVRAVKRRNELARRKAVI